MSDITTGNLRLISQELLDEMQAAFPAPKVAWNSPNDQVKWQAAQHEVVEWVIAKAGQHQTLGTPDPTPGRKQPTGAIVRLGSQK